MMNMSENDDILTADEAATVLRMNVDKVRRLSASGELPCRRVGGSWRYSRSALLSWVAPAPGSYDVQAARPARVDRSDTFVPPRRDRYAGKI